MDWVTRASELLEQGQTFCLVAVTRSADRSVPPGRRLVVLRSGAREGSLGSDELDAAVTGAALQALNARRRESLDLPGGVRVFLDVLAGEADLLICGAGHIAVPLARFTRDAGFRVTVLDDRPDFAQSSRFPGCHVVAEEFVPALRAMALGPNSYVVVITRGHEHDAECLTEVLPKDTAYVGLIGSRRRVRFVLQTLAREGIARDRLDQVFTPIGLPIGAESPEEIALSIAAELVCVRRKGPGQARALGERVEGTKNDGPRDLHQAP